MCRNDKPIPVHKETKNTYSQKTTANELKDSSTQFKGVKGADVEAKHSTNLLEEAKNKANKQ
ncbi:MAG: hypothetical protein ACLSA2_09210 [Candidatus Gastranaerophilaceae bacterium]|mgnify:FL=1